MLVEEKTAPSLANATKPISLGTRWGQGRKFPVLYMRYSD
jgi:hypothetical protein